MELKKYKLNECCEILAGGTPSTKIDEYWNGDIPWLSVKDFGSVNKWVSATEKSISQQGLENCPSTMLHKGDLILSARGTIGKTAIVDKNMAFNQSCFGLRAKEDSISSDFLFYWFKNNQQIFKSAQQGNVFKSVTLDFFDKNYVSVPDIYAQKKIAAVLSAFDDKIALNQRINAKLEAMAKRLYDYWFVQFDFPNAEGKPYKSSGGKMVWNEVLKREIPDGWEVKKCADICKVVTGKEDANFSTQNGNYKFFTCSAETLKCDKPAFSGSAILIAGNGDFNIKHFTGSFNAYQRTYVLIPPRKYYGILFFAAQEEVSAFISHSNGSIVKFITKTDIDNIHILEGLPNTYYNFINQLIEKNEKIQIEIEKLIDLRDRLLPLLMNGQVEVS